jgi:hypothetical protein
MEELTVTKVWSVVPGLYGRTYSHESLKCCPRIIWKNLQSRKFEVLSQDYMEELTVTKV